MSGLRDLDQRVVPRAAARLRAAVERAAARRRAVREGARAVVSPSGPLARLDDRFARTGPLALVREVPQVGLGVALAVLLAGAGVALARGGEERPASSGGVQARQQDARALGPVVGTPVDAYLATSRARAAAYSQERPDAVHVALVSLTSYRTPDDVRDLFEGVTVRRAYVRVPSDDPSEVLSAEVEDLVGDLRALYTATAARKAEDSAEFVRLSRAVQATTDEQRQFRDFYELSAQVAAREAAAYRSGCACVFAVVVEGSAADLAELPALSGVRGVELAPAGVLLEELRVQPLEPEQTGQVAAGAAPRPQPAPSGDGE